MKKFLLIIILFIFSFSCSYYNPIILESTSESDLSVSSSPSTLGTIYLPKDVDLILSDGSIWPYNEDTTYRTVYLRTDIDSEDLWLYDNEEYLDVNQGWYFLTVEWVLRENNIAYGGYTIKQYIKPNQVNTINLNLKEYTGSVTFDVEITYI